MGFDYKDLRFFYSPHLPDFQTLVSQPTTSHPRATTTHRGLVRGEPAHHEQHDGHAQVRERHEHPDLLQGMGGWWCYC